MTKYVITGATGYMGSRLISQLEKDENNYIYAIVSPRHKNIKNKKNVEYIIYDGTEKSLELPIQNSDYLIHLAAVAYKTSSPDEINNMLDSNVKYSSHLFNVANRLNKNIVISIASTFSSLNVNSDYYPETFYAATKKCIEMIAEYYRDLSIHIYTIPDTFGPNDNRPKVHNLLKNNTTWPFIFKSRSSQLIRLLHVDDVLGNILEGQLNNSSGTHYHDIYSEGILLTLKDIKNIMTDKECIFTEDSVVLDIPLKPREHSTKTGYKIKYTEFKSEYL